MVIIKLMGGLASQMHKYALARAIAYPHKSTVKLDLSPLSNPVLGDTKYSFLLDHFRVQYELATPSEIGLFKQAPFIMRFKRGMKRFLGINLFHPGYSNKSFLSVKEFQAIRPPCYIEGEFVGVSYFQNIRDSLIADFQLKYDFSESGRFFQSQILNTNAVSIHFRRGDFISNPHAHNAHAVCSPEYYHKAISLILSHEPNATYFVFSDDIPWVREHFQPKAPLIFVEGLRDYEEFTLMSLCRHNIIANSGFSWFSSWLNNNPEKLVIAPITWHKEKTMNDLFLNAMKFQGLSFLDTHV